MDNEMLERIAIALEDIARDGDVGSQLNLIKGELYEIAGNTKSIAASQSALVRLLVNMSFSCQSTSYPDARFLRVFSESE